MEEKSKMIIEIDPITDDEAVEMTMLLTQAHRYMDLNAAESLLARLQKHRLRVTIRDSERQE